MYYNICFFCNIPLPHMEMMKALFFPFLFFRQLFCFYFKGQFSGFPVSSGLTACTLTLLPVAAA